jgi:hypothetical protein
MTSISRIVESAMKDAPCFIRLKEYGRKRYHPSADVMHIKPDKHEKGLHFVSDQLSAFERRIHCSGHRQAAQCELRLNEAM